ncbi:hypothetical protein QF030_000225 [Streptomyces rishiriensis]|uniref:Uncharacterized protein n=1 Tax=Streptomyces rishiriensis TaxID=68264 RepID=A0ABU0NG15_STRRH|nr:hypothetical protein [Streptomyces rishiriensis]
MNSSHAFSQSRVGQGVAFGRVRRQLQRSLVAAHVVAYSQQKSSTGSQSAGPYRSGGVGAS